MRCYHFVGRPRFREVPSQGVWRIETERGYLADLRHRLPGSFPDDVASFFGAQRDGRRLREPSHGRRQRLLDDSDLNVRHQRLSFFGCGSIPTDEDKRHLVMTRDGRAHPNFAQLSAIELPTAMSQDRPWGASHGVKPTLEQRIVGTIQAGRTTTSGSHNQFALGVD